MGCARGLRSGCHGLALYQGSMALPGVGQFASVGLSGHGCRPGTKPGRRSQGVAPPVPARTPDVARVGPRCGVKQNIATCMYVVSLPPSTPYIGGVGFGFQLTVVFLCVSVCPCVSLCVSV